MDLLILSPCRFIFLKKEVLDSATPHNHGHFELLQRAKVYRKITLGLQL